jgi:predicted polyphosphate/ATP-dependent NAD kinase
MRQDPVRCIEETGLGFVGIIANPASGKDIRRVVSHATVVNNHEKVSIVRRVLLALHALGVGHVEIMPDHFGIGVRALEGLRDRAGIQEMASLIDMPFDGSAADSLHAARHLRDAGAGCIVVLGGDGTCRVVAKGCGNVPLLPLSTGTNNVVPFFIEGTVAGVAAAYVALREAPVRERCCRRHKRLLVSVNGELVDQALIEVTLVAAGFVGSRAVWECECLRQVFVSRAQPTCIGLSSVIGMVHPVSPTDPSGACALLSTDGRSVMTPIAPGFLVPVRVSEIMDMQPGVGYPVLDERPAVLALDGEREIVLQNGDRATVTLAPDGPRIVDVEETLMQAVQAGVFVCQ